MKEHPILFSTPMVLAILEGRKTMTRRALKPSRSKQSEWLDSELISKVNSGGIGTSHLGDLGFQMNHPKGGPLGFIKFPYGQIGDILWVRETIAKRATANLLTGELMPEYLEAYYKADNEDVVEEKGFNLVPWWKGKGDLPSIFMPKYACRIWLEITDIKVERVQSISWADAVAEGCSGYRPIQYEPMDEFKDLWISINKKESWESNPWVWVISFKRINIK